MKPWESCPERADVILIVSDVSKIVKFLRSGVAVTASSI